MFTKNKKKTIGGSRLQMKDVMNLSLASFVKEFEHNEKDVLLDVYHDLTVNKECKDLKVHARKYFTKKRLLSMIYGLLHTKKTDMKLPKRSLKDISKNVLVNMLTGASIVGVGLAAGTMIPKTHTRKKSNLQGVNMKTGALISLGAGAINAFTQELITHSDTNLIIKHRTTKKERVQVFKDYLPRLVKK